MTARCGERESGTLKDRTRWKDRNQRWCLVGVPLRTYWFLVLHERGSRRMGQRAGDAERKKNEKERGENKVGQTEHAECRLGLMPALPLIHLSSFLSAHLRSFLSVCLSSALPHSSCGLLGTLKWRPFHHTHLLVCTHAHLQQNTPFLLSHKLTFNTSLRKKAAIILYFSYCQQIPL